jgi:hypothetical protein
MKPSTKPIILSSLAGFFLLPSFGAKNEKWMDGSFLLGDILEIVGFLGTRKLPHPAVFDL